MTFIARCVGTLAGALVAIGFLAAPARAAEDGTVTGGGAMIVKRQPELLRMQVDLTAKGKTVQEAIAKLKSRREAAEAKLLELGANKASLDRGEPHVAVANDRQRQMEMMVRERMRASGKKAPKKAEAQEVTVTGTLSAEWPLKAASADDLLVAAQSLTDKIKAADVAGLKEAQAQASAEDQEAAEESSNQMVEYGNSNQSQPGEPRFVYVSKISADEENKAFADAFAKAKAHAVQLSHAAGAELGALRSVSGESSASGNSEAYQMYNMDPDYASSYRYQMMMQQRAMATGDSPHEAVGPDPSMVMMGVRVQATFALK